MSNWKKELNDFLAPHGVIFDQSWDEFMQEMRHKMRQTRLPLFTEILLNDGIGSAVLRLGAIICSIAIFFALYSQKYTAAQVILMAMISAPVCIPGFWIWWYRLMTPEMRMVRMLALFRRKAAAGQQHPTEN